MKRSPPPRRAGAVLVVLFALAVTVGVAAAQRPADDPREQAFVEGLRRDDAASADRYVALRDARNAALAELRKAEAQYNAAGAELRGVFVRGLRQAQAKYADAALALIDFHDARDRGLITRYREELTHLAEVIEQRQKARAELEKLKAPP